MKTGNKINLKDLSIEEIESLAVGCGKKKYHGRQLFKWIFRKGENNFDNMTDLNKSFRKSLDDKCCINSLSPINEIKSVDGTVKTIWSTHDDIFIESVLIPDDERLTLCLSSQAGCPVGCSFCATGKNGFKRQLTPGEIYDQYLLTSRDIENNISNIVFMGMGEPLLNYKNVISAVSILTDQLGAGLSARKITISTIGLTDGIFRMADENTGLKLAISLHSAIEEKRNSLIPVASRNKLAKLKEASQYYAQKSGNRVTFEYLLIDRITDSLDDAKALAEFVRGIPCKINLISYNEVEDVEYRKPNMKTILAFRDYLYSRTPAVTLRKSRGTDIAAACGQLAGKKTNYEQM